jgi:Kdo2-lipid IVA lauroyltransferase/acyltransferase
MAKFYLVPKKLAYKAPFLISLTHRLEAAFFKGIFWLIRKLPLETASNLSGNLFYFFGRISSKAPKAVTNLAVAFPDETEDWRKKTSREIFRYLGISLVELVKLDQIWDERKERIEYVLEPEAKKHMASNKATMFVSAHIGPWQVASLVTREFGFITNAIVAPESNPVMNELLQSLRSNSLSERMIYADAGPRPIIRELKAGHSVSAAMDTRPDTGKLLPFFGQDALSNISAVGLALKAGAAVVAVKSERLPGCRYRITVYDPITSTNPEASLKDQSADMTQQIHHYFEEWIREHPEQWVCLKRRWPKANRL